MLRYFFNTRFDRDVIKDEGGTELRDPDEAWAVARDTVQAMMLDPEAQARLLEAKLVVTDEAGEVVLEVPFAEALTPPPTTNDTVH